MRGLSTKPAVARRTNLNSEEKWPIRILYSSVQSQKLLDEVLVHQVTLESKKTYVTMVSITSSFILAAKINVVVLETSAKPNVSRNVKSATLDYVLLASSTFIQNEAFYVILHLFVIN